LEKSDPAQEWAAWVAKLGPNWEKVAEKMQADGVSQEVFEEMKNSEDYSKILEEYGVTSTMKHVLQKRLGGCISFYVVIFLFHLC
jgi:hypothetical protein